jgi:NAD(P)H-hydrate epimerase
MLVVNRWHDAEAARNSDGTILVMKDATTIVVGNGATYFNETGNDGMGTAGSGDVLAGMCGALAIDACNGYRTLDQCAAQAVALHGLAGDLAAAKYGRAGMKAGDILDAIPEAIREAGTAE